MLTSWEAICTIVLGNECESLLRMCLKQCENSLCAEKAFIVLVSELHCKSKDIVLEVLLTLCLLSFRMLQAGWGIRQCEKVQSQEGCIGKVPSYHQMAHTCPELQLGDLNERKAYCLQTATSQKNLMTNLQMLLMGMSMTFFNYMAN